jgi:hypothetical protein
MGKSGLFVKGLSSSSVGQPVASLLACDPIVPAQLERWSIYIGHRGQQQSQENFFHNLPDL